MFNSGCIFFLAACRLLFVKPNKIPWLISCWNWVFHDSSSWHGWQKMHRNTCYLASQSHYVKFKDFSLNFTLHKTDHFGFFCHKFLNYMPFGYSTKINYKKKGRKRTLHRPRFKLGILNLPIRHADHYTMRSSYLRK